MEDEIFTPPVMELFRAPTLVPTDSPRHFVIYCHSQNSAVRFEVPDGFGIKFIRTLGNDIELKIIKI